MRASLGQRYETWGRFFCFTNLHILTIYETPDPSLCFLEQIINSIDLITTNSAKTLNIEENYGIETGKPANFIVLAAENEYEAIRKQAAVRYSIREGKVIAETKPSEASIRINQSEERIHFNK